MLNIRCKQHKLAIKAFTICLPTLSPRLFPTTSLTESVLQSTKPNWPLYFHILLTHYFEKSCVVHIFPSCSTLSAYHVVLNGNQKSSSTGRGKEQGRRHRLQKLSEWQTGKESLSRESNILDYLDYFSQLTHRHAFYLDSGRATSRC